MPGAWGQNIPGFPKARMAGGSYAYDHLQALVDYGTVRESVFPYRLDFTAYAEEEDHLLDYHWDALRIKFAGWHRLPVNDIVTMKKQSNVSVPWKLRLMPIVPSSIPIVEKYSAMKVPPRITILNIIQKPIMQ